MNAYIHIFFSYEDTNMVKNPTISLASQWGMQVTNMTFTDGKFKVYKCAKSPKHIIAFLMEKINKQMSISGNF